ncbi:hypothetical protein B7494_g7022 [Chlorociboria aeruginascens]|nr:hypothetical protein B7494_g7022 [Chlorociboria aeruginascens]
MSYDMMWKPPKQPPTPRTLVPSHTSHDCAYVLNFQGSRSVNFKFSNSNLDISIAQPMKGLWLRGLDRGHGNRGGETHTQLCFEYFPKLPQEVRDMIWSEAFRDSQSPRIIEPRAEVDDLILFDGDITTVYPEPTGTRFAKFFPVNPPKPSVISLTCRESRKAALKEVAFCFSYTHDPETVVQQLSKDEHSVDSVRLCEVSSPGIMFQPSRDTIYLRHSRNDIATVLLDARSTDLQLSNIRSLALDEYFFKHHLISSQLFRGWPSAPPFLTNLKELIVVLDDNSHSRSRTGRGKETHLQETKEDIEGKLREIMRVPKMPTVVVMTKSTLTTSTRWEQPPNERAYVKRRRIELRIPVTREVVKLNSGRRLEEPVSDFWSNSLHSPNLAIKA